MASITGDAAVDIRPLLEEILEELQDLNMVSEEVEKQGEPLLEAVQELSTR